MIERPRGFRFKHLAAAAAAVAVAAIGVVYVIERREPFVPVFADQLGDTPPAGAAVTVTYIANEGVLIASGDTRVLIDGLFRQYKTYPYLPQPHRDAIESAAPPFDGIDLILVSHMHGDHFHPESVARHLDANPGARLVSSGQVVNEVKSLGSRYAALAPRLTVAGPAGAERVVMTVGDAQVEVVNLGHGTGRNEDIQNFGHILTVGGKKFLHVGDADPGAEIFRTLNLRDAGIDVAILPLWFLTGGAEVVRDRIRAKHIIAVHVERATSPGVAEALAAFPNAAVFTRLLEKRSY